MSVELLSDSFGPGVDETTVESAIVPENPFRLARDIVDPAEEPLGIVSDVGLAVMLKSPGLVETTLTVMVVA